ncbi:MAG: hypothetical protein F7C07_08715 [Desulfurococcales archaeon]|nr:hypothetical protein [Desulfurococcales archaeon]
MSEYVVVKFDERAVSLLTRILNIEYRRLQLELRMVEEKIKRFEKKYDMSSSEFLKRYSRGELGDEEGFMEWYGELKFLERIHREMEELKKIADKLSRKIPSES